MLTTEQWSLSIALFVHLLYANVPHIRGPANDRNKLKFKVASTNK